MDLINAWLALIVISILCMVFFGLIELLVVFTILQRTGHRLCHLAVPAGILLFGGYIAVPAGAISIVFFSFVLIAPMAALLPVYLVPELTDRETAPGRVIVSYLGVCVFESVLTFWFFSSGLVYDPNFYYYDTWLNNAVYFCGIALADGIAAFAVLGILLRVLPFHRAGDTPAE